MFFPQPICQQSLQPFAQAAWDTIFSKIEEKISRESPYFRSCSSTEGSASQNLFTESFDSLLSGREKEEKHILLEELLSHIKAPLIDLLKKTETLTPLEIHQQKEFIQIIHDLEEKYRYYQQDRMFNRFGIASNPSEVQIKTILSYDFLKECHEACIQSGRIYPIGLIDLEKTFYENQSLIISERPIVAEVDPLFAPQKDMIAAQYDFFIKNASVNNISDSFCSQNRDWMLLLDTEKFIDLVQKIYLSQPEITIDRFFDVSQIIEEKWKRQGEEHNDRSLLESLQEHICQKVPLDRLYSESELSQERVRIFAIQVHSLSLAFKEQEDDKTRYNDHLSSSPLTIAADYVRERLLEKESHKSYLSDSESFFKKYEKALQDLSQRELIEVLKDKISSQIPFSSRVFLIEMMEYLQDNLDQQQERPLLNELVHQIVLQLPREWVTPSQPDSEPLNLSSLLSILKEQQSSIDRSYSESTDSQKETVLQPLVANNMFDWDLDRHLLPFLEDRYRNQPQLLCDSEEYWNLLLLFQSHYDRHRNDFVMTDKISKFLAKQEQKQRQHGAPAYFPKVSRTMEPLALAKATGQMSAIAKLERYCQSELNFSKNQPIKTREDLAEKLVLLDRYYSIYGMHNNDLDAPIDKIMEDVLSAYKPHYMARTFPVLLYFSIKRQIADQCEGKMVLPVLQEYFHKKYPSPFYDLPQAPKKIAQYPVLKKMKGFFEESFSKLSQNINKKNNYKQ